MPKVTEIRCKQACIEVGKGSPTSWNLNIYRGCMHKCIYCFALYSHDYLQTSDSSNYYNDIYVKTNIARQLEKQLSSPSWDGDEIGICGVTDCYQPLEAKYKLMPDILRVLIRHKNPCSITTKSDLILRDYDLIDELSRVTHVSINASISCMDNEIRKKIEPGGKNASAKFHVLKEFSKTNATTGVLHMPIIPFITDQKENIEELYANAADSKVNYIMPGVLFLRGKTREAFFDAIRREFPELLEPLTKLYRNQGAGKAYKNAIYKMVKEIKRKYPLARHKTPREDKIEEIKKATEDFAQLSLFDTNTSKTYQSSPIPSRDQLEKNKPKIAPQAVAELDRESFVEIEMGSYNPDSSPTPVALPPLQPIDPAADEKRTLIYSMRQIARDSKAFADHSKIFYEQARFMEDFEDNYTKEVPFSSYFPYYQRMGYDQLRTYFTWRTKIRNGKVTPTSTSYAFLYIYELLNQIGVDNPEDGLNKLITFWQSFRIYDETIDKYVLQWLKDYHIYYPLPHSFREFAETHQLIMHYPTVFCYESGKEESFDLFATISKYNIKKSTFYSDETKDMINDSFFYVLEQFRELFRASGQCFEDLIFNSLSREVTWIPFDRALFYPSWEQSERQVALSQKEIYNYRENRWKYKSVRLSDHGQQLVGYIIKEMECSLRKIVKFKYKLTAKPSVCDEKTLATFEEMGISITEFIQKCVKDFHVESTRIEVSVDVANLGQIRQEALQTQEKLIVPEEEPAQQIEELEVETEVLEQELISSETASPLDIWQELKESLTKIELEALEIILSNEDIKKFAADNMIMLEVLVEGINDKAMDYIGDAILELDWDGSIIVYDEYQESLVKWIS